MKTVLTILLIAIGLIATSCAFIRILFRSPPPEDLVKSQRAKDIMPGD
jgi:hypothetical protein